MNILLTGGSRGIGKAINDYFTEHGHNVIAPTRQELDVSNYMLCRKYGSNKEIDILINCAGMNNPSSNYYFDAHMDVNFSGPKWLCDELLPIMRDKKYGRILNIGSIWIEITKATRGKYSISKAALHAMTKQIAVEYGQYNILCNTLSPGFIETEMTYKNNTDEEIAIIQKEIPIQRLGKPEEVAKLAYFLTVENTYINGQNIIMDGGYSICA
jgi:3-oxoacyl-[acyl-carrier protein] reductase